MNAFNLAASGGAAQPRAAFSAPLPGSGAGRLPASAGPAPAGLSAPGWSGSGVRSGWSASGWGAAAPGTPAGSTTVIHHAPPLSRGFSRKLDKALGKQLNRELKDLGKLDKALGKQLNRELKDLGKLVRRFS